MRLSHRAQRSVRLGAAAVGLLTVVLGSVLLIRANADAAVLLLVTFGFVVVLVAWLGPRVELESLELLGARIRVRDVVTHRLQLAEAGGAGPADRASETLRQQAAALQELDRLYRTYAYVRRTQAAGARRTSALDTVAARMRAAGRRAEFSPTDVATWFQEGDDALRVVALNLMLARQEQRDLLAVLQVIDDPHSLFEQYYGLRLADEMLPDLDPLERQLVVDATARARRRRRFRRDPPLMALSEGIVGGPSAVPGA